MILRKFHWTFLVSLYLLNTVTSQDETPYEDDEWVPITPKNPSDNSKKAEGRVLNLAIPSQNYFPENEYVPKQSQPQQYIPENSFQKGGNIKHSKPEQPYKFESILSLQPPQYIPQNQFVPQPQFIPPLQQLPYIQTLQQVQQVPSILKPIRDHSLNQQLVAPPQNNQNYYDSGKTQVQSNKPQFNEAANIGSLNQELLGGIQNQNINQISTSTTTSKPKEEKESVQLLYVPLENLRSNQQLPQQIVRRPATTEPPKPKQISNVPNHKQDQLTNIEDDFIKQALAAHKLHQQLTQGQPILLQTTTTTERPKKRKANQPPLAVYMEKQGPGDIKEVLHLLKNAKSISVQDSVGPDAPKVFVGPSTIDPEGYVKFPLPYLSTVQGNRIERKVEQLPFFVAPLSYKTPEGYSKIPLPSPHVGSVVVSTTDHLHGKLPETKQPHTDQNQVVQDFDVKQPFTTFRDQPKPTPNPYFINQDIPQPTQNTLFGFNDFLGNFPNNGQNYEVSSSKGFTDDYDNAGGSRQQKYEETPSKAVVTNYQLPSKDTDDTAQYYVSTPKYKTTENVRVRNNYQIPEYQTNTRNLANQTPKEVVQDYDIPSIPVESKTTFAPTYQIEQKPQIAQFPNFPPQKSPADVYNINEEVVRPTTTTVKPVSITPQTKYKLIQNPEPEYNSRRTKEQNPFSQVINQYEIEQINSQLGEEQTDNIAKIRSTTPAIVTTQRYRQHDIPATARGRGRTRHRGRTTTTTAAPTPNTIAEENYTVLEEFAAHPKTSTAKYATEVETIPAKVYKLEAQPPEPVYVQKQSPRKQVLNQEALDQQILHGNSPPIRTNQDFNQQFLQEVPQSRPVDFNRQFLQENIGPAQNVDSNRHSSLDSSPPVPATNFNQQFLQETTPIKPSLDLNQQLLPENLPSRPTGDFNQQFIQSNIPSREKPETDRPIIESQDPRLTPQVYNQDQIRQNEEVSPVNPYLPGLINNLQDQAVRPLLVPNLLVPTTEKLSTPVQPSTEEVRIITTTTETPRIETTTQRRSRGRQRAHTSRYSTTSTPRRTANRRRPNYTRPTTERQYVRTTTEAVTNYEPTRRVSSQRQRFRTRGRPVVREQPATERIFQTTESAFKPPPLEGGFQASPADPQSFMQFDHVIDNQQVITVRPEVSNDEAPLKEYHQVYSLPTQQSSSDRVSPEISTTSKPVVDVKITHPITDRPQEPIIITTPSDDSRFIRVNSNIQSGGVYNNRNEEGSTRSPARTRIRSRTRSRFSSTTPRIASTTVTTTTTPKPQNEEQEVYGFIRKPDFNRPAPVIQTTQQSPPLYSSHYQESPKMVIQLDDGAISEQNEDYRPASNPAPVQFVGQIKSKYPTESQEYSTEAPKPRSRARIRIPSRKASSHQQQSYNELKPQRLDDQVTRRSSVVRTRSRGKSHFKVPESLAKTENPEEENYPANYLKNRELTTHKPSSFQITIDPSEGVEEDQEPHSSLYSPQIIRNTDAQWVEAAVVPGPNELEMEDKQLFVTSVEEQSTISSDEASDEETETTKVEEETDNPIEETKQTEEAVTVVEEMLTTTETVETTTPRRKKNGRRRGVWKLVKHRPVDAFETAESQNYYSVLNGFDMIEKKNKDYDYLSKSTTKSTTTSPFTTLMPATTSTVYSPITSAPVSKKPGHPTGTTTTESSIFETIYSMLGLASKASQLRPSITKVAIHKEEITTTTASPTFPEEYTEETTTQEMKETEENRQNKTTIISETTTLEPTTMPTTTPTSTTTEASIKNYDVEPWEMREVRTSTSTEVSHETEICYKGKCIKSKEDETTL